MSDKRRKCCHSEGVRLRTSPGLGSGPEVPLPPVSGPRRAGAARFRSYPVLPPAQIPRGSSPPAFPSQPRPGNPALEPSTQPPPSPARLGSHPSGPETPGLRPGTRLVVIANRLPVHRVESTEGSHWETSPGGLVSALAPLLSGLRGSWVGWSGGVADQLEPFEHEGIQNRVVPLSRAELEGFYQGFSNRTLWPLYHDAVRTPEFRRRWWWPYIEVNRRYAQESARALEPGDTAWVQDYHLQLVPAMLRNLRPDVRIGFFLHIPFPPVELFAQLPWRRQILEGLLGADLIGFQTRDGAQNFLRAARRFAEVKASGKALEFRGRRVQVGAFPISIDVDRYDSLARSPGTAARAQEIRESLDPERRVVLGVDRLDYTKGIDIRLRAFEALLEKRPHAVRDLVFIQIAVPSRESVDEYAEIRTDIEQKVGHINGTFGEPGRIPVHYLYRNLPCEELVAYYCAADVMLVTPLRDGMNLVAKEYVASRVDGSGCLVLSEFAGAACELRSALHVNPHDIDGLVAAMGAALDLPAVESRRRMSALRRTVNKNDVHHWSKRFLESLSA